MYYGEDFVLNLPKMVVSTNSLSGTNVDTRYYPLSFNYSLLY